jgi:hypothetical protein
MKILINDISVRIAIVSFVDQYTILIKEELYPKVFQLRIDEFLSYC